MILDLKSKILLEGLVKFYNKPKNVKIFLEIISSEQKYAKRIIEWGVSNYSKKHNIILDKDFNIFYEYKIQLKSYSKEYFDPFRRKTKTNEKFIFNIGSQKIDTTIGQLNFFRWTIENNIISFIKKNYLLIKEDMKITQQKKVNTNKRKRLCNSNFKNSIKEYSNVTLNFN